MTEIEKERICVEVEGEIVFFLIGMRINKVCRWLPVVAAMPRVL